ncbi:MAG: hypothetical protein PHS80_03815, partial [Methanothrix sp.]|nr:hypothetical protein [Methanothrix sp.]
PANSGRTSGARPPGLAALWMAAQRAREPAAAAVTVHGRRSRQAGAQEGQRVGSEKAGMAGARGDLRIPFCEQASLIAVFRVADCTKKISSRCH